jgi:hypothetical protein
VVREWKLHRLAARTATTAPTAVTIVAGRAEQIVREVHAVAGANLGHPSSQPDEELGAQTSHAWASVHRSRGHRTG